MNNKKLNLSELPDAVRSILYENIAKCLNSNDFEIDLNLASKRGENNFVGFLYRATFAAKTKLKDDDKIQINSLIVKVAPKELEHRNIFTRPLFLREIFMYNEILPILREFERSKCIIDSKGSLSFPKCYQTGDANFSECLLLEALDVRGFSTVDQINADHVTLVMQELAKFHAISFAFRDQNPNKFDEITSPLTVPVISRDRDGQRELLKKQSTLLIDAVSQKKDAYLLAALMKFLEREPADVALDCFDLNRIGPATVILHGDAWHNNFMFRHDTSGKPVDVCLIDLQLSLISPMYDITCFIFCSTTKNLRDIHYNSFLKTYHESLSTYIRRLGSDPGKLFSWELMQEHLRKFARHSLIIASLLLPLLFEENGNENISDELFEQTKFLNTTQSNESKTAHQTQSKLMNRLREIIIDMVRLDYINEFD